MRASFSLAARNRTVRCVLLSLVCFACYANAIPNDYAYDDAVVITENHFTQKGIAGIPDLFTHDTFAGSYEGVPLLGRYRPLSLATFAVELDLFGRNPHLSHFDNVLLLALTSIILYLFLAKLFGEDRTRLLDLPSVAALLFVVHPIHTEVVTNIKGRDELLVLAGSVSAALFVLMYLEGQKRRFLVLSACCFLVALFSKEDAIAFLAVVPLTIAFHKKHRWKDYVSSMLPLAAAALFFLGARWLVVGGAGYRPPQDILTDPFVYASRSQRLPTILHTFAVYLRLLCFPHPLTTDYNPFHVTLLGWSSVAVWLSLLACLATVVYALWSATRRSVVGFGILFFWITFFMVSNLPFPLGTFMSERFMFIPSVGFVLVVAQLLAGDRLPARYRNLIVVVVSILGASQTWARNSDWKDDLTLLTADARTSHNSIKANMAAAVTLLAEAQKPGASSGGTQYRAEALKLSQRAVELYKENVAPAHLQSSSYGHAVMLLGNCYAENDRLEEALRCYKEVVNLASDRSALTELIQTAINKSDDVDFRLRSYLEFVGLMPDSFSFNYHLGLLYGKEKGDLPTAVHYFGRAVDIAPDDVNALKGLSHAYQLSGDYARAALYFEKLVDHSPPDPALLVHLRGLYERAGNQAKGAETERRLHALVGGAGE